MKLIETLPKKGYVLHALISEPVSKAAKLNFGKARKKYLALMVGVLVLLLAVAWKLFEPFILQGQIIRI